uniref:Uncharacterized protein n=1 Tax=Siphoviridae sp. ctcRb7 TaxID=2825572 RepID=A0A8S5U2Y7_9CAUD|nr:MAG TPA: hypothetical protein [Siphoviridae sp. ctcRb7]
MSATEKQTAKDLRNLMDSLDTIIDQLNSSAFEVVGHELSVMHGDLERVTFNLECVFDLEVGE